MIVGRDTSLLFFDHGGRPEARWQRARLIPPRQLYEVVPDEFWVRAEPPKLTPRSGWVYVRCRHATSGPDVPMFETNVRTPPAASSNVFSIARDRVELLAGFATEVSLVDHEPIPSFYGLCPECAR